MSNLLERLLARLTDRSRAAAIAGDLNEMANTRGRLWFWFAYAWTLISLGWRTPVALLLAMDSGLFLYRKVGLWMLNHPIAHPPMPVGIHGKYYWQLWIFNYFLTALMVQGLFFALPFILIRFGIRDRLSQLGCGLFLITLLFQFVHLSLIDIPNMLCELTIAVALLLPLWRRPMIVLAATCFPAVSFQLLLDFLRLTHFFHAPLGIFTWSVRHPVFFIVYKVTAFTLGAVVCVSLYGRLLQGRTVTDRTLA